MAQGVASACREKNGAASVTSFQWEQDGDVVRVASFLLERGRGRMAGSMSSLLGDAVGRGGKGRRFGRLADRFLVELVQASLPVKAALRPWSESSTAAPTGVVTLLRRRCSNPYLPFSTCSMKKLDLDRTMVTLSWRHHSGVGFFWSEWSERLMVLKCGFPLLRFLPQFGPMLA